MATKPKMSSDITIKEKVVKPGYLNNPSDSGVLTITWALGTNGSEHKINAYRVYWRNNQGQKPTTSTHAGMVEFKVADLTLKNGKYTATINLSQAGKSNTYEDQTYSGEFRRGHQIVVGMIAVGGDPNKGSVLESDMVYSNSKCYINDLPQSPSNIIFSTKRSDDKFISPVATEITHNTTTRLPYNGGKITFTGGTPGQDTYTYSNLSIYYSSTLTGTKSKITSTSSEKTYTWKTGETKKEVYFWTYDGLEYSKEPLKFTIEREPELIVEDQGFNGEEVVTKRNDLLGKYVISPRISYSTNKQAQLKVTLFISRTGLTARQIEEPINGFNYTDIRKHFTNNELEDGAMYYFKYYFTDGYMDTTTKTSQSFYVAPKPKIQDFRDQLCASNNYDYIVETRDIFYRDLTFFIEQDSAWPINKIIAKDSKGNKKTYAIDFSNSDQINLYNNNSLVSYTFRDLTPGEQYEFSLVSPISNLFFNEQNIEFISPTYLTKLKEPNLSNVSINGFNPSVFKPYSANNDLEVFVNKFLTDEYFLKNWTFQWSSSPAYTSNEFPDAEYSDDFIFKIPFGELSKKLLDVNTFNKNGRNFIMPTIRLYTEYGNYYEIKSEGLAIDFSEPLDFNGYPTFEVTDENNNNIDYLKEKALYSGSVGVKSYNGAPYVRLLIKYGEKDYVEVYSFKLSDTEELPENGKPIEYYQVFFSSGLDQIIDLYTTAEIKFQCSKYSNFENPIEYVFNKTYPAYGHIAPSFLLKSATYDKENKQIKADFDNVNLGIHPDLYQDSTIAINILDGPKPIYTVPIDDIQSFINNPTASFPYVFSEDKSVAFVGFRLTVKFTKKPSTTYSNGIHNVSVYNILPTVSYRQNHLSINRDYESNELNDGIIIINDYDIYKKIYLVSQSENKILSIDVQTGALDGFIINGGTW